jgi:hypothetical protein
MEAVAAVEVAMEAVAAVEMMEPGAVEVMHMYYYEG